jgi:hypothetical protein
VYPDSADALRAETHEPAVRLLREPINPFGARPGVADVAFEHVPLRGLVAGHLEIVPAGFHVLPAGVKGLLDFPVTRRLSLRGLAKARVCRDHVLDCGHFTRPMLNRVPTVIPIKRKTQKGAPGKDTATARLIATETPTDQKNLLLRAM